MQLTVERPVFGFVEVVDPKVGWRSYCTKDGMDVGYVTSTCRAFAYHGSTVEAALKGSLFQAAEPNSSCAELFLGQFPTMAAAKMRLLDAVGCPDVE